MKLKGKNILITGAAVRIGRAIALRLAEEEANILLHYGHSDEQARETQAEVRAKGSLCHLLQADLNDLDQAAELIGRASEFGPIDALINNAAIFEDLTLEESDLAAWQRHMNINLTAPFVLSKAFAEQLGADRDGRIINLVDWRALRPGADHLPYTISKAGLVALTRSLAASLAPRITVNGVAFGAILPPSDGGDTTGILGQVPAGRWAELEEVGETILFLLTGPAYITGEIIHLDGGRHLI